MCDFMSYIERNGKFYYLTDKDLNTARGKKLLKKYGKDINGHGAIREFYDIEYKNKIEKEQTDFSSPNNFPKEIATAIKNCEITKLGISEALLNASGLKIYRKQRGPIYAEYQKQIDTIDAEYRKQIDPIDAEYRKQRGPIDTEYQKQIGPIFWKIFKLKKYRNKNWM